MAQIATFGTLAARAAIKDVGRVLDLPLERVTQLTNMVPKTLGITLDEALKESAELKQAYESDPEVRELIDIARKLEGTNRNAGTHAAGVVIANGAADRLRAAAARGAQGRRRRLAGRRGRRDDAMGAWATWKRSACSRWTSWACAP